VRENLAEKQQSDPELGLLVKLRLLSVQRPTIDQLATEAEGAKRQEFGASSVSGMSQ